MVLRIPLAVDSKQELRTARSTIAALCGDTVCRSGLPESDVDVPEVLDRHKVTPMRTIETTTVLDMEHEVITTITDRLNANESALSERVTNIVD